MQGVIDFDGIMFLVSAKTAITIILLYAKSRIREGKELIIKPP